MKLSFLQLLLVFLLVFPIKSLWSQDTAKGVIILHVAPLNAIIYLDSFKQKNHAEVALPEGKHVLKIWAPDRQLVNETFYIMKDSTLVYVRTLPYTDEYLQYRKKKSNYILSRTVPPVLTVISTALALTSYSHGKKMMDQYHDQAKQAEHDFYSSFAQTTLEMSKVSFNQAKDRYEEQRAKTNATIFAGAVIIPVGIATSVYLFVRSRKPYYQETPLLTRVNGDLFLTGNGGAGVSLSYKF